MRNPLGMMRRRPSELAERAGDYPQISFDEWAQLANAFQYMGNQYTLPGASQDDIAATFRSYVRSAFKSDSVVFSCIAVRMLVFSEARFQFRQLAYQPTKGGSRSYEKDDLARAAGKLFGTQDLALLEHPWPGATTGDLLAKAILYADLGGNAYFAKRPGRLFPMRPDWVTIVIGSNNNDPDVGAWDVDSEVVGYIYQAGGPGSGNAPVTFLAEEVAHFAPIPDPEAQFRGMSWITPIVREIMADKAATDHKLAFFENAATVNLSIKLDTEDIDKYKNWIEVFREQHEGRANAYKTLFLAAGATPVPVGANLEQADFKVVQGAGETRVAAASGTPPILVGLSEGLQAATYSNYLLARRRFADGTIRPLWRNLCGSLETIIEVPPGAELWYDESDIAFLREDQKDVAQITSLNAISIRQLVDGGFEPDAAVTAVVSNDLTALVGEHTGLYSVQLQPAGEGTNPDSPNPVPDPPEPPAEPDDPAGSGDPQRAIAAVDEVLALTPGEPDISE